MGSILDAHFLSCTPSCVCAENGQLESLVEPCRSLRTMAGAPAIAFPAEFFASAPPSSAGASLHDEQGSQGSGESNNISWSLLHASGPLDDHRGYPGRALQTPATDILSDLLDDLTLSSVQTLPYDPNSSWQEEAHWMSFRNAVHCFVKKHRVESDTEHTSTTDEGRSLRVTLVPATRVADKPLDDSKEEDSIEEINESESGSMDRYTASPLSSLRSPSGHRTGDTASTGSMMATELAEMRMRLALAEAERDELEYALKNRDLRS